MKSEISVDHAVPGAWAQHLSPLNALTLTTHHLSLLTASPSEGQKHPLKHPGAPDTLEWL